MAFFTAEELEEMRRADEELERETSARRPKKDRSAYKRRYYQANKERILQCSKMYREKHREEIYLQRKAFREKNREAIRERNRAYYQANKERIKEKSLAYHYEHRDACLEAMRERNRRLKREAQV